MKRELRTGLSYPGLLLGCAALLCSALLALTHGATREAIAQRHAEDLLATLAEVIPARRHDNDLLAHPIAVTDSTGRIRLIYRATQRDPASGNARVTGVAFDWTANNAYNGPVKLLLGIADDGGLLGVRVLSHSETPGLGDKLEAAKSDWIHRFSGRSLDDPPVEAWKVKKDGGYFDQFSGATITPRAVVSGVKEALIYFRKHQASWTQAPLPRAALSPDHAPDTKQSDASSTGEAR